MGSGHATDHAALVEVDMACHPQIKAMSAHMPSPYESPSYSYG